MKVSSQMGNSTYGAGIHLPKIATMKGNFRMANPMEKDLSILRMIMSTRAHSAMVVIMAYMES